MIDLAYTNYGLPDKAWAELQKHNDEHLKAHPVCEICGRRPSVRITPIGMLKASCVECIDEMRAEVQAQTDADVAEYHREEAEYRRRMEEAEQFWD